MLIWIFSSLLIYCDFRKLAVRKLSVIQFWASAEIRVKTGHKWICFPYMTRLYCVAKSSFQLSTLGSSIIFSLLHNKSSQ